MSQLIWSPQVTRLGVGRFTWDRTHARDVGAFPDRSARTLPSSELLPDWCAGHDSRYGTGKSSFTGL